MRRRFIFLMCLILVGEGLATSCSSDEEARVKEVLEARRLGLEKKDIGLYMSSISPRYGKKEGEAERLRQQAMSMMQGCDSIQMRIQDCRILISQDRAQALQAYEIRIRRGGQIRVVKGQERIGMKKEVGGWKIISGL